MNKINWKVRFQSSHFWVGIVSALAVFVVSVASLFGFDIAEAVDGISNSVMTAITALFAVGAAVGVITDPTTEGLADSAQALTYVQPKPKGQHYTEDAADAN